jgi:Tfp pilus assembly protein PilX
MSSRHRQSGLSLLIAMIVLVVMSMAAIGLIRSVDTGILAAGNLAFRQSATHAGDAGIEAARTWLLTPANFNSLANDSPANGYFATSQAGLDLTGNATTAANDDLRWDMSQATRPFCLANPIAGNTVCYIIHRMCNATGPLTATNCSTKPGVRGGSSLGGTRQMQTYQQASWASVTAFGYYRVTVRVAGPRNNVSFVQAYLTI